MISNKEDCTWINKCDLREEEEEEEEEP